MPHRPMITIIVAVYDGVPSVPDVPIVVFRMEPEPMERLEREPGEVT